MNHWRNNPSSEKSYHFLQLLNHTLSEHNKKCNNLDIINCRVVAQQNSEMLDYTRVEQKVRKYNPKN